MGLVLELEYDQACTPPCACCYFTLGTGESIPFRDNSFDAISSILVFSYLRDPGAMLREAYRVLRPGGAISICTLGKNCSPPASWPSTRSARRSGSGMS